MAETAPVRPSPAQKAAATRRANATNASSSATPSPSPSSKRWAREFDACLKCGKDDSRHQGKGICERCSRAERRDAKPVERAPLRGGPGKLSAVRARNVKVLITGAIVMADMAAGRLAPVYWTPEDRLQQDETTALVRGVYAELEAQPKLLEWLAAAADQGVHGQLAMALAMIALPRLMRRGVVPPDVAAALAFAFGQPPTPEQQPQPDAVSVEAGPAREPERVERNGQEHSSFVPGRDATVHSGFSEQAG